MKIVTYICIILFNSSMIGAIPTLSLDSFPITFCIQIIDSADNQVYKLINSLDAHIPNTWGMTIVENNLRETYTPNTGCEIIKINNCCYEVDDQIRDSISNLYKKSLLKVEQKELEQLKYIDIEFHQQKFLKKGFVPPNIFSFFSENNNIESIKIQANLHHFSIPDDIAKFSNLKHLSINRIFSDKSFFLRDTDLVRPYLAYPSTVSSKLQACHNLETLECHNQTPSPPPINGLTKLKSLIWSYGKVMHLEIEKQRNQPIYEVFITFNHSDIVEMPSIWGELSGLEKIHILNPIQVIPNECKELTKLKDINLTSFQQEFPTTIWSWQNAIEMDLKLPYVSDVPDNFHQLPKLKKAYFYSQATYLSKSLLKHENLEVLKIAVPQVKRLYLGGNSLSKSIRLIDINIQTNLSETGIIRSKFDTTSKVDCINLKKIKIPLKLNLIGNVAVSKTMHIRNCSQVSTKFESGKKEQIEVDKLLVTNTKELNIDLVGKKINIETIECKGINQLNLQAHIGGGNSIKELNLSRISQLNLRLFSSEKQSSLKLEKINIKDCSIKLFIIDAQVDLDKGISINAKNIDATKANISMKLNFNFKPGQEKKLAQLIDNLWKFKGQIQRKKPTNNIEFEICINNYLNLSEETRGKIKFVLDCRTLFY